MAACKYVHRPHAQRRSIGSWHEYYISSSSSDLRQRLYAFQGAIEIDLKNYQNLARNYE